AGKLAPPRQAANVRGIAAAAPRVFTVEGVRIGVFGVAAPERVRPLQAGDPRAAAREAVAALQKKGAQVIVALLGMSRPEARAPELARLDQERPAPPPGSYFTYALVPVRRALPRDPAVARRLAELDRQIGAANFAAAQKITPPPPEPGLPAYAGGAACARCH